MLFARRLKIHNRSLLWCALLQLLLVSSPLPAQTYIWPTDATRYLTSSFGEYRERRFHMGIDIKTWNRTGYRVFAMADGYLGRMLVSPFGYGKALYIRTHSGETLVYGHLDRFAGHIEEIALAEQDRRKRYSFEKYFESNAVPVRQGDLIAYSGKTGIGTPHLHIEIRDAANRPLNPSRLGLVADDAVPPTAHRLAFIPLDAESRADGDVSAALVDVTPHGPGDYRAAAVPKTSGRIGLAIQAHDNNGQTTNNYSVYTLACRVDEKEVFRARFDRLEFDTQQCSDLYWDYRLRRRDIGLFDKLYVDPNAGLRIFGSHQPGDGILDGRHVLSDGVHAYAVDLTDGNGNVSRVTGRFEVAPYQAPRPPEIYEQATALPQTMGRLFLTADRYETFLRLEIQQTTAADVVPVIEMTGRDGVVQRLGAEALGNGRFIAVAPYGPGAAFQKSVQAVQIQNGRRLVSQPLEFDLQKIPRGGGHVMTDDGVCRVNFPSKAAYQDLWVDIATEPAPPLPAMNFIGNLYTIQPGDIPFDRGATVTLRYPADDPQPDKLGIYYKDSRWHYLSGSHDGVSRTLSSDVTSLEQFILARDVVPPVVRIESPPDNARLTDRQPLVRISVADEMSGIRSDSQIAVTLDGQPAIAAYDPEEDSVTFRPRQPLPEGSHTIKTVVTDMVGNTTTQAATFHVVPSNQ